MARSPAEQKTVLSKFGVQYLLLLELPYFDPIRSHVIDPMHNLLLRMAKHMMNFQIMDQCMPSGVLPLKYLMEC